MKIRKAYFLMFFLFMENMHNRNMLVDIKVWLGYDQVHTLTLSKNGGLAIFLKHWILVYASFT